MRIVHAHLTLRLNFGIARGPAAFGLALLTVGDALDRNCILRESLSPPIFWKK